jgi:serine/threonine protein kinase
LNQGLFTQGPLWISPLDSNGRHSDRDGDQFRRARDELARRLRAGESCGAEDFLEAFPSLAADTDCAIELICTENAIRRELGQHPSPVDCYARFPNLREALKQRLESGQVADRDPRPVMSTAAEATAPHAESQLARIEIHGRKFGRYTILEEVGRGGMGVVYKAHDPLLNRLIALKVVRGGLLGREEEVERFYREARAAAQLDHAQIVKIHDVGCHEQQPYYTMALIGGGSLARQRRQYAEDPRAAAALVETLARALHHAHEKGIVHRDLKPANILLDQSGQPWISDFGLAKLLDDPELTRSGQLLGTPAYMAPEQAQGRASRAGPPCDVWALGVILYELLTGRRPFQGETSSEVTHHILYAEPPRLRSLCPRLDRALEGIVLKCLEKKPELRYGSALALADDLARWRVGETVQVSVHRPLRRLARNFRRWRVAVAVLVALLFSFGGIWLLHSSPLGGQSPSQDNAEKERLEQLAQLRSQLAAGIPVQILDDSFVPRYYRWVTERSRPPITPAPNTGRLHLQSWGLCLVELLPDVPVDRYRISADIRHADSRNGYVGLYFAAEDLANRADWSLAHCTSAIAEAGELAGHTYFFCDLFREANGTRDENRTQWNLWNAPFPVAANSEWHTVTIDVSPEKFVCSWDNRLEYSFDRKVEQPKLDLWWSSLYAEQKQDLPPQPTFSPRGGLGIILYQSGASLRNVQITPRRD